MLLKLDVLETLISGAGLKNWGAQCEVKTLHSLGFEFLPNSASLLGGRGCYSEIVSQPPTHFDVGLLSFSLDVNQSFSCFLRGSCSIFSCRFNLSRGRGEPRILLCHHLEPEPQETPS